MNLSIESSEESPPVTEPVEAWIVVWSGTAKVKLHKILKNLTPSMVVIETSVGVYSVVRSADVYPDERNACLAAWLKHLEDASSQMAWAKAMKKRADELNK